MKKCRNKKRGRCKRKVNTFFPPFPSGGDNPPPEEILMGNQEILWGDQVITFND